MPLTADNSSNVMMYALVELALHPEIQEEFHKEIHSVCGDRLPQFSDLSSLVYGLCIMYETMRLYPIIGSLSMTVIGNKDVMLLGKYPIAHDARFGVDLYNLHRNEKYWGKTAHEFNPARFDIRDPNSGGEGWYSVDGKTRWPVRGAFWGFSEGPRACVGRV